MTHRLARLLPLAAILAILGGLTIAFAAASGSAAGSESTQPSEGDGAGDIAAACLVGAEECEDTVDAVGPDIAPLCVDRPAADCVDMVEPDNAIADCQYDPCYDTPALVPDPLADRCKLADDMVACIADPDAPVSTDDPSVKPAEPPDAGPISEPYPGSASPEDELREDIAAREECRLSGAC